MPDDVTRAFAFVARRQGKRALGASTWTHVLSLDLGWMTPAQAAAFVERARASSLLVPDGEDLRLEVDPATVDLPRGFRPDPGAEPAAAGPDPFLHWLGRVERARSKGRDAVLADVAARQDALGGLVDAQTAVLWLAAEAGMDVREAALAHVASLKPQKPKTG